MNTMTLNRRSFLRVTALSLGAGILSVAANFALIPRYGMVACAWVTVIGYTILMLGNFAFIGWIERRAR